MTSGSNSVDLELEPVSARAPDGTVQVGDVRIDSSYEGGANMTILVLDRRDDAVWNTLVLALTSRFPFVFYLREGELFVNSERRLHEMTLVARV